MAAVKIIVSCASCNHPYRVAESFVGKTVTCRKCGSAFVVTGDRTLTECPMIGRLALNSKFITEDQLRQALKRLEAEKGAGRDTPLEAVLQAEGFITPHQLEMLLSTRQFCEVREQDIQFGRLAIEKGWTSGEAVDEALTEQSRSFRDRREIRFLGDILVARGNLAKDKRDFILVGQGRMEGLPVDGQTDTGEEAEKIVAFDLAVSPEKLSAVIRARDNCSFSLSVRDIKDFLQGEGIAYGIVEDAAIEEYIRCGLKEKERFEIACGKPPVPGTDAAIEYAFDAELFNVGKLNDDGTIDFKERGEVPQVAAGDLLAEKIPLQPGEAGINVFGEPIPVAKPRDVKLRCGTGAELSEDKTRVLAKIAGQPKATIDGKISVMPEMLIKGDVDLKTGNIYFDGNIRVTGSVQNEFKVKGGSLVAGEILAADIDVAGDVIVSGGIIGARIRAQGNVQAKYIKNGYISAFGDVIAQKELIDSRVETSGVCRILRGKLISSTVAAKKGIEARDIGTDMSSPSKLYIGVEKHVEKEITGLKEAIQNRQESIAALKAQLELLDGRDRELHQDMVQLAQLQDRAEVEQRKIREALKELDRESSPEASAGARETLAGFGIQTSKAQEKITLLFGEQAQLQKEREALADKVQALENEVQNLELKKEGIEAWSRNEKAFPVIKTSGVVQGGTRIHGVHASLTIKEPLKNFLIKEVHIMDPDAESEWEVRLVPPR